MVWFYERQGNFIRCETRDVTQVRAYELVIVRPDGTETVERFADSASLDRRQQELQSTLVHDGWQGPFGRTI
jgi:hypothetical protein